VETIKAAADYADAPRPYLFLAGSIEMGAAEEWQARLSAMLLDTSGTILNPRRDDWDASWSQEPTPGPFMDQVHWELNAQSAADVVVFYFSPETKSPITLLELGLALASRPETVAVCCPAGFWRRGNVVLTCERYGVTPVDSLDALAAQASRLLTG
jgi:hypothetical protein